jgi:guanine deaminase
MCLSAIYWARIKTVYYGNTKRDAKNIGFDDELFYEELNKPNDKKQIKMIQLETKYNKNAFDLWVKKLDKIKY